MTSATKKQTLHSLLAESMHPAGNAHAFEYNSVYLMD